MEKVTDFLDYKEKKIEKEIKQNEERSGQKESELKRKLKLIFVPFSLEKEFKRKLNKIKSFDEPLTLNEIQAYNNARFLDTAKIVIYSLLWGVPAGYYFTINHSPF